MSRRMLFGCLSGVAIMIVGTWVWCLRTEPAHPGAPLRLPTSSLSPAAEPATQESQAVVENASVATATPTAPTRTVSDTLLAQLPALEARLAQGEREAGWQAYRALQRCLVQGSINAIARNTPSADANAWVQSEQHRVMGLLDESQAHYCAGTEKVGVARPFDLLLAMAERGDLQAQLQFTLDPPLYRMRAVAEIELILRYRQRAPDLLDRALQAGSRQALMALLDAHTPAQQEHDSDSSTSYLSPSTEPTDQGAVAYMQRYGLTRTTREPPHRQILRPDLAEAYKLALICQHVCRNSYWLQRANQAVLAAESTLSAGQRLDLQRLAEGLWLGAFSRPITESAVTWGEWWNTL